MSAAVLLAAETSSPAPSADRPPGVMERVAPVYPPQLLAQRIVGHANIRCTIDEQGNATNVMVDEASQPEFGAAAKQAIEKSKYTPAIVGGKAARKQVMLPVLFDFSPEQDAAYEAARTKEELPPGPPLLEVPEVTEIPILAKEIRPKAPASIVRQKVIANVIVAFVVDEQGRPRDIHVVAATQPDCGDPVVVAVREWRFSPGRKDGQAVRVNMWVPIAIVPESNRGSGLRVRPGVSRDLISVYKGTVIEDLGAETGKWKAPVLSKVKEPDYPGEMLWRNLQGEAKVEYIINPAGIVTHVRAINATNDFFAMEAERAVSYWKFQPATKNGRPVFCRVQQIFTFQLSE